MIAGIKGRIEALGPEWVIVDVGGFLLRVQAPTPTLQRIGRPGDQVQLHTHLQAREDAVTLFGFATAEELRAFEDLITVNGVGPKAALAILSHLGTAGFARAIHSGDVTPLTAVPGIGRKLAGRILLELRGKLTIEAGGEGPAENADLIAALVGLGYTQAEAYEAVSRLPPDNLPLEERLRLSLRHLSSA